MDDLLRAILEELRGIRHELAELRGQAGRGAAVAPERAGGSTSLLTPLSNGHGCPGSEPAAAPLEAAGDSVTSVSPASDSQAAETPTAWPGAGVVQFLTSRAITVTGHAQGEQADLVYDRLAQFLGERFDSLGKLHDLIRRNHSHGTPFSLNLSCASQREKTDVTNFCTQLHSMAFVEHYNYARTSSTVFVRPSQAPRVINFFTGGWFERWTRLRTEQLLQRCGVRYELLANPKIQYQNGDTFELDLVLLVEGEPLWIECKTGDYQGYVSKYSEARRRLGIPATRSILAVLGLDHTTAAGLSRVHDLTFVSHEQYPAALALSLGLDLPEDSLIALPPAQIPWPQTPASPAVVNDLSVTLNHLGLRPCREQRQRILSELLAIVELRDEPVTLADCKHLIANVLGISKSQIQDVLNAVVRTGLLLDANGEVVASMTLPFAAIDAGHADALDQACCRVYAAKLREVDPHCLDSGRARAEFQELTGSPLEACDLAAD